MPRRARGFALLEIVVALALLAGAVVALAGLLTVAARANRLAHVRTAATLLATQKMEQLLALAWGYGPAGEDHADRDTDVSASPEAPGGTGVRAGPDDTLTSNVAGFVDYLDADNRWIGAGPVPAPGTVYVRRWAIRPLPDSPLDTLVFRVVVVPLSSAPRLGAGLPLPVDAVQLVCLRSRRGT